MSRPTMNCFVRAGGGTESPHSQERASARRLPSVQTGQQPNPRTGFLLKGRQNLLLDGAVHPVVNAGRSYRRRFHAQSRLGLVDFRNRTAVGNQRRLGLAFHVPGLKPRGQIPIVPRNFGRPANRLLGHPGSAIGRKIRVEKVLNAAKMFFGHCRFNRRTVSWPRPAPGSSS